MRLAGELCGPSRSLPDVTRERWRRILARLRLALMIANSRQKIVRAIGASPEITFVRSWGNIGDEFIYAGTRRLLARFPFREISVRDVALVRGHTAVLSGGGAWCGPFHEVLPAALHVLEERFERVIVLPSSYDVSVQEVRDALAQSKAEFFARELESYRQIKLLCRAKLALDCAFFYDLMTSYRCKAAGVLVAFRTDRESARSTLPPGSVDVSVACESLDEWLWTIARHELVVTDRAHVMIAGALLGRRVIFQPTSYHKLPAIASYSLQGFPVKCSTDVGTDVDTV